MLAGTCILNHTWELRIYHDRSRISVIKSGYLGAKELELGGDNCGLGWSGLVDFGRKDRKKAAGSKFVLWISMQEAEPGHYKTPRHTRSRMMMTMIHFGIWNFNWILQTHNPFFLFFFFFFNFKQTSSHLSASPAFHSSQWGRSVINPTLFFSASVVFFTFGLWLNSVCVYGFVH